ncbi:AAA family ATPase [Kitasatospora sp. NPDC087271]|uniref:AAA family ATPase n=1 Tax=Kitasatospora sp. NPDC087271 TaxID=3364067 RepID=UPI00381D7C5B
MTVRDFRGIAREVTLDLMSSDNKPGSALILGDNGTGKSSLADAFEFCLRGKVSRRGNAGAKTRREAQNLLTRKAPFVQVELEDSQQYIRGGPEHGAFGVRLGGDDFAPGFSLCPTVLSRSDIEVFWKIDPAERMRFFFDYLRETVKHTGYAALEIERRKVELQGARTALLEAQIHISGLTGLPVASIPITSREEFAKWRNKKFPAAGGVRNGTQGRKRYPSGGKRFISPEVRAAILNLENRIEESLKAARHIASQKKLAGFQTDTPPVLSADLPRILQGIAEQVSTDFAAIARLDHIREIRIKPSEGGAGLEIDSILSSGHRVDPTQVLSESSLDLLALLVMLGVAAACSDRGQNRFLILDDVWQSVDAVHRNSILDYLFGQRFKKWQLLITVHDRLWARLIEEKARKNNFPLKILEVTRWSAESGPSLTRTKLATVEQLSELMANAAPEPLCAYSGRALEELADRLSMTMRVSVGRAPGDRYTLEDLWPGVFKAINKASVSSSLKDTAKEVNEIYALRNIYGAHYSTWAESMSRSEIGHFAMLVVAMWEKTHCTTCGAPLSLVNIKKERIVDFPCTHQQLEDASEV